MAQDAGQQEIIDGLKARDARWQGQVIELQETAATLTARDTIRQEQTAKQQEIIATLTARDARNQEQNEALLAGQKHRDKRLSYYQNTNAPPSSDSLAYKKARHQRVKERKNNQTRRCKKPGAKKGHKHAPRRRYNCGSGRWYGFRCSCKHGRAVSGAIPTPAGANNTPDTPDGFAPGILLGLVAGAAIGIAMMPILRQNPAPKSTSPAVCLATSGLQA